MQHSIYLDGTDGGPWMGHLLAEPGCIWLAPTPAETVARAPAAITQFYDWLRHHGEPDHAPAAAEPITVMVAEQQAAERFGQSGGAVGLFTPDHAPVSDADIATAVRRLGYARRDLLELVVRAGIYRAENPDEDWTPRKMLRRFVEHEREHVAVVGRTIAAWRTGGPVARPWSR